MTPLTKSLFVIMLIMVSLLTFALCLAQESKVPFAEYADAFAEAAGHKDIERNEKALIPVLENSYVAVKLGLFDVWHPRALLKEGDYSKRFKTAAGVLLDLQETWIDWVAEEEVKKSSLKDLKALKKWVKAWRFSKIIKRRKDEEGRPELLDLLKAKDPVREASGRLEELLLEGEFMGRQGKPGKNVLLILAPNRENFIQMASFVGSLRDYNRNYLWQDSMATWTTFDCEDIQAIAMEYPATTPGNGDITQGTDMNGNVKTGLRQHVMMNAAEYLITHYHKGSFSRDLILGFATNMVIENFKEISIRTGTGSKGNRTAAYSIFVPGGNSAGGTLPGRKAKPLESRWRKDKGKDYFIGVLRKSQKQGAKVAAKEKRNDWNRIACFPLESASGVQGYTARAPFFVSPQDREPIPEEYTNDYKEFFRAYQCAFAFWIRSKALKPESDLTSADLARQFLGSSSKDGSGEAAQKIYGMPLTGKDDTSESLEWLFLEWLAKG
jgi:hypothetical protein